MVAAAQLREGNGSYRVAAQLQNGGNMREIKTVDSIYPITRHHSHTQKTNLPKQKIASDDYGDAI